MNKVLGMLNIRFKKQNSQFGFVKNSISKLLMVIAAICLFCVCKTVWTGHFTDWDVLLIISEMVFCRQVVLPQQYQFILDKGTPSYTKARLSTKVKQVSNF